MSPVAITKDDVKKNAKKFPYRSFQSRCCQTHARLESDNDWNNLPYSENTSWRLIAVVAHRTQHRSSITVQVAARRGKRSYHPCLKALNHTTKSLLRLRHCIAYSHYHGIPTASAIDIDINDPNLDQYTTFTVRRKAAKRSEKWYNDLALPPPPPVMRMPARRSRARSTGQIGLCLHLA
jgi:hypothetical protein